MCGIGNGIDSYQWGGTTTLRTKKKTAFCVSCKLLHLFYCAVEHLNMGGFGGLTHFWVQPWVASRTAVFCCWWVFFFGTSTLASLFSACTALNHKFMRRKCNFFWLFLEMRPQLLLSFPSNPFMLKTFSPVKPFVVGVRSETECAVSKPWVTDGAVGPQASPQVACSPVLFGSFGLHGDC